MSDVAGLSVWVLREEIHYEGSHVLGVFLDKEDARRESHQAMAGGKWRVKPSGDEERTPGDMGVTHYLEQHELRIKKDCPLYGFALGILCGDSVACDAARDVLKI